MGWVVGVGCDYLSTPFSSCFFVSGFAFFFVGANRGLGVHDVKDGCSSMAFSGYSLQIMGIWHP